MRKSARQEVRERAGEIMKKIGLDDSDRVLDSYPFELSGGMNQRVGNLYSHDHASEPASGR